MPDSIPDTYLEFVVGYLALFAILGGSLVYLFWQLRDLKRKKG